MRKIRVCEYSDDNRPHLKFVVNYREAGKRKRTFFETRRAAESFARFKNAQLRRSGVEHVEIPTSLRVAAQNASRRLARFDKTIDDAVEHYLAHLKACKRSIKVTALVTQLIAAKEADGMSGRYVQDLRSRLSRFAKTFGEQMVAAITTREIDHWLRSLEVGPTTRNNFRRVLVTFFSDAVALGYAIENPALNTAKATETDSPPGILTVTQAANLLTNATPELLPYVAIGLFAGLRRAELERLDWCDVHFDDQLIEVTAAKSKTARRRFVKIQPNLCEWLAGVREHSGKIAPGNLVKQLRAARKAAGIIDWPDNALRHSFASYHLAHFKDAAGLALEMGHMNEDMIFNHYRQLVRPKEAERYWSIKPLSQTDQKIVAIA